MGNAACAGPGVSAPAKITSGFSESFRRGIVTLPKIRNPKLEIRNKFKIRKSSKAQNGARLPGFAIRISVLWVCFGFRISGFRFVWPQMAGGPLLEFRLKVEF